MSERRDDPLAIGREQSQRVGRWLCLAAAAVGAIGLLDDLSGARLSAALLPGEPPIHPTAALGLLLAGSAGALRAREGAGRLRMALSVVAATLVLALGALTLAEQGLAIELHLNRLLAASHPGVFTPRPTGLAALLLVLLAAAILLIDSRPTARARPSEWLALGAWLIGFAGLLGFVFGAEPLGPSSRTPVIGVALPTAICSLFISTGLLLCRPSAGIVREAAVRAPGGTLLRRLVPATIVGPTLLSLVALHGLRALGVSGVEVLCAVIAASMTFAGLLLLVIGAPPLTRAHEALEHSRAQIGALLEQGPDGIFLADLQGRYTDVNGAGCRMLGMTRDEVVGKTISDLIPESRAGQLALEKAQLLRGETVVSEWVLRKKDGSWLPVEVSAKILPDGRWQGFVRDISERKRLEAALEASHADLVRAQSVAGVGSWRLDVHRDVLQWSEEEYRMFGVRPGTPMTYSAFLARVHPDDRAYVDQEWTAALRGRPYELEHRIIADGEVRWVREKADLEFDADHKLVGGIGVTLHITEQKRLQEQQQFLAEVGSILASSLELDKTLTSIGRLSTRSFADFCIVYLQDPGGRVRRLSAVSKDPGKDWACELLARTPFDRAREREVWAELDANRSVLLEHVSAERVSAFAQSEEHLRALRALDPRSAIMTPLFARGRLVGAMALGSSAPGRAFTRADVAFAERIAQLAAYAIDNAELYASAQRAIQSRDGVLGIVAHDLRNPLSIIQMQAGLLRRRGAAPERRTTRPVDSIERAGRRMNRIIQDLLDVVRIEEGRLRIERALVSCRQVVLDVLEAQAPLAARASLTLELELEGNLPEVWADRDRLFQIFENLVGNALKFTEEGGVIRIGGAPREREVLFWVADTGAGIDAEQLPHLFDRFWQVRGAERFGLGLGLSIVKGLVEAHGGRIWAESEPGRGSTFFLTIPSAPRADEVAGHEVAPAP